jgi:hypothetical protein
MTHALAQAYWISAAVVLAGILHMFVVKRDRFAALKRPLDGGRRLRGRRIFGDNKTWRGVIVMVASGAALGAAQGVLGGAWAARRGLAPVDYAAVIPLGGGRVALAIGYAAVGALIGLGYVAGELPNSFLKRQLEIAPGEKGRGAMGAVMLVADHSDSVVASMALAALVLGLGWRFFAVAVLALSLLHFVVVGALFLTGVKRRL